MRDHTCNGVPTAQLSTEFLEDCLRDGIGINEVTYSPGDVECVMERIRLELFIREHNLRG